MKIFDFLRVNTNEDQFAKQVMRRMRNEGWSSSIRYDREKFALILEEGGKRVFLHNLYRAWSAASPADKSKQLDLAIAFIFEAQIDDDFEQSKPLLLPAIRNRSELENQWLDAALEMDRNHYEDALKPFCDGLAIVAAIDQPTSISLLNQNRLSKWSRSLDEVLAIAIDNLRARSSPCFDRMEGGFYVSTFGDYYDASRLLIPQLFENLSLRGDPVAIAVTRAGIVVAGSEDVDALNAMVAFVEGEVDEDARPISNIPLALRDGEWREFDCSGPAFAALDRLRAMQWLQDYADQKALLEPYFERTDRDVFVATLGGIKDGARVRTWATWTSEAISLLPEADAIALARDGMRQPMVRHWSDVVQHCGPLKLEEGLYPRRYLVEKGPDDAAWERLGRCEHPAWFPTPSSDALPAV